MRFVTSFSKLLYEASGRRGIETFRRHNPDYELVAYLEADDPQSLARMEEEVRSAGAKTARLDDLPLLPEFFESARDVIPRSLGGDVPDDLFPGEGPSTGSVWFRKHMIRWFRKIVALDHSSRDFTGPLFWIDCDCFCTRPRYPIN